MMRFLYLTVFVFFNFSTKAQFYKQPNYPQNYFRWCTNLNPDIVANMGELRNNHWHMGLDVRTNQSENQRVVAAADGYISYVGIEPLSWGRWIIINHPNGISTLYGHLNDFEPNLEAYIAQYQYKNETWVVGHTLPQGLFKVKKGDFIAYSGNTGGSQGPHIHLEYIDTQSGKRLNPSLFGQPITDHIPPTIKSMAIYDRNISTYYQTPAIYNLVKKDGVYQPTSSVIKISTNNFSVAINAYDTRNGTANQDGIYSARTFLDGKEITAFYIDSIGNADSRYMNAHIDYKYKAQKGGWLQHTSRLPGEKSGVYKQAGTNGNLVIKDSREHEVKILVADANGNESTVQFFVQNPDEYSVSNASALVYEWKPNAPNKLFKPDFETFLPVTVLYDGVYSSYQKLSTLSGLSSRHKLGETFIPIHSNYTVKLKAEKPLTAAEKEKVLIKLTGAKTIYKKPEIENDNWFSAEFRDFGIFELVTDSTPPVIPSIGSGEIVRVSNSIRLTPTDNTGIDDFKAALNGKWLRFTNDKGRTWMYKLDKYFPEGVNTLTVTVKDIAGNTSVKTWQVTKGAVSAAPAKTPSVKKETKNVTKPSNTKKVTTGKSNKNTGKSSKSTSHKTKKKS